MADVAVTLRVTSPLLGSKMALGHITRSVMATQHPLVTVRQLALGVRTALDRLELRFDRPEWQLALHLRLYQAERHLVVRPDVARDLHLRVHWTIYLARALQGFTIVFAQFGLDLCLVLF